MGRYGDIDLLVRLDNNELCVIEIKSWQRWNGYLRIKRAFRQIHQQTRAVRGSYGYLWLTKSVSPIAQLRGNVVIVGGNARFLVQQIQKFMRYEATIKFPQAPASYVIVSIKLRGFIWDQSAKQWEGYCNESDIQNLQTQIERENGRISFKKNPPVPTDEYEYFDEFEPNSPDAAN